MKRFLPLFFIFTFILSNSIGQINDDRYIFEPITKDSGVSFSRINAIATDKNNMLWFGCDNGLYYYNNETFTRFKFDENDNNSISSSNISKLYHDSRERLWVASDEGLDFYDYEKANFVKIDLSSENISNITDFTEYADGKYLILSDGKLYRFSYNDSVDLTLLEHEIIGLVSELMCSSAGDVYIGTTLGDTYISKGGVDNFKLLYSAAKHEVTSICESYERVYIGYLGGGLDVVWKNGKGVIKEYRADKGKMSDSYIPSNDVRAIVSRTSGDVWVGTSLGLAVISPSSNSVIVSTAYNQLQRNSIFELHVDRNDAIWIGTWAGHVAYYSDANFRFRCSSNEQLDNRNRRGSGRVYHFAPNDLSTVWMACEFGGVSLFDYTKNRVIDSFAENLKIKSITNDGAGNLWIGTLRQGLYCMDIKSHKITKVDICDPYLLPTIISCIELDVDGETLWVGTRGKGMLQYNTKSGKITPYNEENNNNFTSNYIWGFCNVTDGLLIATVSGLVFRDSESGEFTRYNFDVATNISKCIYSMNYDEKSQKVYLATRELGVMIFDIESRTFEPFDLENNFDDNGTYDIVMDKQRNLWFSTDNGIYSCNVQSGDIRNFTTDDGLNGTRFHPNSCCLTENNMLFFGSTNGFNYINLDMISNFDTYSSTYVSRIRINGRDLSEENYLSVNSRHIVDITDIELSHDNNSLTFNVVSDNIINPQNDRFDYRLIGYDNDWNHIKSGENIVFTKIPFGHYKFEVRTHGKGGTLGDVTVLNIRIVPPIYLRWYAILLYIILLVLLIITIVKELALKIKMREDIEVERQINIVNGQSFDEKMKFFMNVSHELRTPLSLILAPLAVLERDAKSKESRLHINAIKRNAKRLLNLTNQILDFRLLEVGRLKAIPSRVNLVELCRETYEYFDYQIIDQKIEFRFDHSANAIFANLDREMIGKTIYNLLSNALKYTNEGGAITLTISKSQLPDVGIDADLVLGEPISGDVIIISIEDSGCGIAKEDMTRIFDRFYFNPNEAYSSSGIGLHMCKEYLLLNGGNIAVTSTKGEGSKFIAVLPQTAVDIYDSVDTPISVAPFNSAQQSVDSNSESSDAGQNKSTVLIVDDSSEIRFYLKQILGRAYNCVTAKNGQQGFEMAQEVKPDIIILDMLMPIVGGVDCIDMLRKEETTKAIPIIMLSSLTDEQSVVKAMKCGADGYLSKPINEALVYAHIERLLQRPIATPQVADSPMAAAAQPNGAWGKKGFFESFEAIINQNIQNGMLDVNFIADKMQVSRSTLQRSVKAECGMGVAEYIRDSRLRYAVKLMNSGVYNVDELSVCVGFNSSSYFCKAFKAKYGESPKKYCDSLKLEKL